MDVLSDLDFISVDLIDLCGLCVDDLDDLSDRWRVTTVASGLEAANALH